MTKILVTGAAGGVGANLVKTLAKNPKNKINILILKGTWHPYLNNLKINVFYGDVRNPAQVEKAMKGCDYVFHVAGIISYNKVDKYKVYSTHVNGVSVVLSCANKLKVKKVVVTASTAGLGISDNLRHPLNENAHFNYKKYKHVMYMYSKHKTIEICKDYAKHGLNVSIVSPTTIYGEGDVGMHIISLVRKIKKNKVKKVPPGGNSVVSMSDVITGHILAMEKGKSGENYILSNEIMSYYEIYNIIAKLVDAKPIEEIYGEWLLPIFKFIFMIDEYFMLLFGKHPIKSPDSVDFKFKYRYFDSSKARSELGWAPKVHFELAMERAIEWYNKRNLI